MQVANPDRFNVSWSTGPMGVGFYLYFSQDKDDDGRPRWKDKEQERLEESRHRDDIEVMELAAAISRIL